MFCSSMEAPKEVKEREWCRNAPGTALSKAILVAILAKARVAVGHAYGDKGVDYVMDAIDEAMKQDPSITLDYVRSRRFSSDHCGFYPRPAQIPRMANLGWYMSCGGNVLSRSYPWLKEYGMQYASWIAPIKSLINAKIKTVYENEAGVNGNKSGTYWQDGYALMTRKNEYGDVVAPQEAIDRITLMKMSTIWPAEYVLREKQLGSLEAGKLADLIVLNKDYFTIPEAEIPSVFPLMTVVGGKIEVLRAEYATELGRQPIGPQLEFQNNARYGAGE
jgi:predicted amidohydrolase YtcJ